MRKIILFALTAFVGYYVKAQTVLLGRDHQPIDTTYKSRVYPNPNEKPYTWGIGLKYRPGSISGKWYGKSGDAIEVLLTDYHGARATGLLELSPGLSTNGRFRLLVGPGLHIGIIKREYLDTKAVNPVFGVDGIGGFEYTIPKIHLAFQLDYQPSFDFNGDGDSYLNWGGLTVRYVW